MWSYAPTPSIVHGASSGVTTDRCRLSAAEAYSASSVELQQRARPSVAPACYCSFLSQFGDCLLCDLCDPHFVLLHLLQMLEIILCILPYSLL